MINIKKRGDLITECYYFDTEIDNRFKKLITDWNGYEEKRSYLPTPTRTQNRSFLEPSARRELIMGFKF
jgi:hypothetical protein